MGFAGSKVFKITNSCGMVIKNVRITHFLKGDKYNKDSELYITESMNDHQEDEHTFHSISDKDDNWTIAFQISDPLAQGCYMCKKLTVNMKENRHSFKMTIYKDKFEISYVESDTLTADNQKVTNVYDVIG